MNSISLVAADLDGTLFYDREHITPRDRAALDRLHADKIHFVFATGRELRGVTPSLDLHNMWDVPEYVIHSGGSGIFNVRTREDEMLATLSPETLCDLYDCCKDMDISILMAYDDVFYTNHMSPILRQEAKLLWRELVEPADFRSVLTRPNAKFILNGTDEQIERVLPVVTALNDERYCFHRSHDNYIDCYAAGATKGTALALLCERMGIGLEETLAVGDNLNDLQLLETAGVSACPGDGHPALFPLVDYVACPACEGAVADACEHFIWVK